MIEALSALAIVMALVLLSFVVSKSMHLVVSRLDTQNMLLDKIARKLDRAGEGG